MFAVYQTFLHILSQKTVPLLSHCEVTCQLLELDVGANLCVTGQKQTDLIRMCVLFIKVKNSDCY